MARREPLTETRSLEMFAPVGVLRRVKQALLDGQKVELEYTSFTDPGPDETRVLIDGERVHTIPGY